MEINNRTNFEYNNRRERERRYLSNGNSFQSKDGDYRNNHLESITGRSTTGQNNKRSTSSTDSSQRNSVVFEHIVPGSVKKMWVMAESGSFDKQEQPEQKSEQRL